MNKKKLTPLLLTGGGILASLFVIMASYAYWQITRKQVSPNDMVAACLNFEMKGQERIKMDDAWPISDEAGRELTGYDFTVENKCEDPVNYIIALEALEANNGLEYLNNDYVKLAIDDEIIRRYGSLDVIDNVVLENDTEVIRETREVTNATVAGNSINNHTIRIWLSEDAPLTEQNKVFASRVRITGGQGISGSAIATSEACFVTDGNGEITSYKVDSEGCGTNVVIPARIGDEKVKVIDSNAFKGETLLLNFYDDTMTQISGVTLSDYTDNYNLAVVFDVSSMSDFQGNEISYLIVNSEDADIIKFAEDTATSLSSQMGREISVKTPEEVGEMTANQLVQYNIISKTSTGEIDDPYLMGWVHYTLGMGVIIDTLDLSKTTYLEKVEEFAFSNATSETDTEEEWNAVPTSLDNLVFGNNDKEMVFERGAFAKVKAENLTLYPTYKNAPDTIQNVSIQSAFMGAQIDNVVVSATADVPSYSTYSFDSSTGTVINWPIGNGIVAKVVKFDSSIKKLESVDLFRGAQIDVLYATPECTTQGEHSCGVPISASVDEVIIPDGVTQIGTMAFNGINLKRVTIPSSVITIGDHAFEQSSTLTELYFEDTDENPSQLESIGKYAFASQSLPSGTYFDIVLPRNLKTIGNYSFEQFNIGKLTIPSSIETIGEGAFRLCQYITNVTFEAPSNLKTIGDGAFQKSTSYGYNAGTVKLPNALNAFATHFEAPWNVEYY